MSATLQFHSRFRFRLSLQSACCFASGWRISSKFYQLLPLGAGLLLTYLLTYLATAETWRYIDFSRWRPRRLNTTSGFLLVDANVFGKLKFISKPNFVDISQLMAEICRLRSALCDTSFKARRIEISSLTYLLDITISV